MGRILKCLLSVVLSLVVYGCFGSRERGDKVDPGFDGADVIIETGGSDGRDTSRAGSGGIDGGQALVGGNVARPMDAAIVDVGIVQAGTGDIEGSGGAGGIYLDDDAGTVDAPCAPNCPDMNWVTIPGGTFMMGSVMMDSAKGTNLETEYPQHEVTVRTFRMSKTEVTVAQYGVCVDAGVCDDPSDWSSYGRSRNWGESGRENHPINGVIWSEAREYAQWVGGRLPSEAEWEYAARSGGQDIVYPWGNEDVTCELAVIGYDESDNDCGNDTTAEVCSKPLGNTAQGLCDTAGNVWEWVEDDWHDSYSGAPSDGQAWIDSPWNNSRVLRGGSWNDPPSHCRSAVRGFIYADDRYDGQGFRVVLDVK